MAPLSESPMKVRESAKRRAGWPGRERARAFDGIAEARAASEPFWAESTPALEPHLATAHFKPAPV